MKILHHLPPGRSALLVIATIFLFSAVARLGTNYGQAIAKGVAELGTSTSTNETMQCDPVTDIGGLVSALNTREARVASRERELSEMAQSLALAKEQIRLNMTALVKAEDQLSATIAQSESAAEDDLDRLTSVYENMKPKEAATLFEEMHPAFAAGFIGRMRPDAAAPLLAELSPQTAYSISVILAGRNANQPPE